MRIISVIITIVLVFLFGVTVYLVFQNRNSEALRSKVIPAIVIALVVALSTLWFSLESEKIELKFISTIFFNKSDKLRAMRRTVYRCLKIDDKWVGTDSKWTQNVGD
jgi:uncharacterized membrane protein YbhN (UPF0104 family)